MKAIVENPLNTQIREEVIIFVSILNIVTTCNNEKELREAMSRYERIHNSGRFFNYGFGSNHMWVCQTGGSERLIFVEF